MPSKNEITSLSHEDAYEEVSKFQNCERHMADGCDVYRGLHPEWGPTIIIFPAFGNAVSVPMSLPVIAPTPDDYQPEITVIKNTTFE